MTFRVAKGLTDGELFDSILKSTAAVGYDSSNIRFYLEDSPFKKTSAVERAVKAFPELTKFRGSYEQRSGPKVYRINLLSNFGPNVASHMAEPGTVTATSSDAIPSGLLSEILHGVPRRFAFHHVTVCFDAIPALNVAGLADAEFEARMHPHSVGKPGILLESKWWTTRRMQNLSASLALPVPSGAEMDPLPPATENLVSSLGKLIHAGLWVTPSLADADRVEQLKAQATAVGARYTENPFAGRPNAVLPRNLPPVELGQSFGVPLSDRREAAIPSIKDLLKQELAPLGYRYKSSLSGQGGYTLMKRGSQNYVLEFFADASPWGGQFCSSVLLHTPFFSYNVTIQLPPHGRDYPINSLLPDVIANTAFVVKLLEETFVTEIESIFGPAPKWFADSLLRK